MPGAKTLARAMDKIGEHTTKYRKQVTFDLQDLNVTPAVVTVVVWDPLYVYLQQLPLPPARQPGETSAEWIDRCRANPPDADVRWCFEPRYAAGTRKRVYTGDSNCGAYFKDAMEVNECYPNYVIRIQ